MAGRSSWDLRFLARSALALCLAAQLACLPKVKERCRLVTEPIPAPALPADLARLDGLLLRRANEMTLASREMKRLVVWDFRVTFAGQLLSILCGKLEVARELAVAGHAAEAGRKYQALLVASQVVQMDVAMHLTAQYADAVGQPGGQINRTLDTFEHQVGPLLDAALSEDPKRIERALNEHPEAFRTWGEYLEQWPLQVQVGAEEAKTAKLVWDITFLVIATYQAASAAAEIAAARGPPMMPLPAFAPGGAAAAAGFSPAASLELAETIRRLLALGVLDAGVMVALSKTLGGPRAPPLSTVQMSSGRETTSTPTPAITHPTRGMGGRMLSASEKSEFDAFARRAQNAGLKESPFRTGSWGRFDAQGTYREATRIDVGEVGQVGWRGQTHMHIAGSGDHLPLITKIPGEL